MRLLNRIESLALAAFVVVFTAACEAPEATSDYAEAATDYAAQQQPSFDAFIHVLNTQEYDKIEGVFAPDFRRVAPDQNANGPEEMLAFIRQVHDAYQDLKIVIGESVYVDGLSFNQWTVTGIATAEDGTEVSIEIPGVTMLRYADGMITEEWVYYDTAPLTAQLGTATMPHAE